jgi:hypothetical protein
VIAQDVSLEPELVHTFYKGSLDGQVKILPPRTGDTAGHPIDGPKAICFFADGTMAMLDNLNGRLVAYSADFKGIWTLATDPWNVRLSLSDGKMIGWQPNASSLNGMFAVDEFDSAGKLFPAPKDKLESSSFSFCAVVSDIVIFQDTEKSFFGFTIPGDGKLGRLLGDGEIRDRINSQAIQDMGYSLDGDLLTRYNQLLSTNQRVVIDQFGASDYVFQSLSQSLSNGNFFFGGLDGFWIADTRGKLIKSVPLPKKFTSRVVSITPAPNGFAYFLYTPDTYDRVELYRVGPFPELTMAATSLHGTVNDDHVRLRQLPSTQAAVLNQLSKGDLLAVLSKGDSKELIGNDQDYWYKVRCWDGRVGWVFGAFLDIQK